MRVGLADGVKRSDSQLARRDGHFRSSLDFQCLLQTHGKKGVSRGQIRRADQICKTQAVYSHRSE